MVFNNDRVTEWFRFVKGEIRKYDPEARVHIKLMPWLFTGDKKDHGIDFEALTRLCDICGCDAMTKNSDLHGRIEEWMDRYSFEWVELSMMFDFFRSVQPNQIIFDTETHILSSVHFRDLYLKPDYVRATYWLAHMHGLNASRNWVWGREESGEIMPRVERHYPGTNNQQPAVLNELHATLIDLNRYPEEITAIQLQRKPLRIYYSLTNAINRMEYMHDVYTTYESLYFDGIPLGYATEGILRNEDPSGWDAVLVRQTESVTREELNALQAYLNGGGTLIMDEASLRVNQYGQELPALSQGNGKILLAGSTDEMRRMALDLLQEMNHMPAIRVEENSPSGLKGCVWRCVRNDDGNHVLTVVNVGKNETGIRIIPEKEGMRISCRDLINGIPMKPNLMLKRDGVIFAEVSMMGE
jgi:beta-galactosidase